MSERTETPAIGNLLYTQDEEDLRATLRALLTKQADPAAVRDRTESAEPTDRELWTTLAADVGCAGLAVPEALGGAGASWREVAVAAEELGRAVAPVPFLGSSVLATALLLELVPVSEDAVALLALVARGELVAALVVPAGTSPGSEFPTGVILRHGRLTGTVGPVLDAGIADLLLVPADGKMYAVGTADPGVSITPMVSLDMTRPLSEVSFATSPSTKLAKRSASGPALEHALQVGAAVLASEQLGLIERCLSLTVEYVQVRHQFGRPIGGYQAIKHRLADVWVTLSQAKAVARYAAECAATGSADLPVAASLAQAYCSAAAQYAAEECIQLHGGIGFTWEHPAHLYLKRAKADSILLGTADRHRALLAGLVDLPGPVA